MKKVRAPTNQFSTKPVQEPGSGLEPGFGSGFIVLEVVRERHS